MTERDLLNLLQNNPDLSVDGYDVPSPSAAVQAGIASEHDLQAAIVAECDRRSMYNPAWGMIAAIPNGQYRKGQRMEPGLRAGLPDLVVLLPRQGYHAAFLELKHGNNKPSQLQMEWVGKLNAAGYYAGVFWEYETAMSFLERYVEGK